MASTVLRPQVLFSRARFLPVDTMVRLNGQVSSLKRLFREFALSVRLYRFALNHKGSLLLFEAAFGSTSKHKEKTFRNSLERRRPAN